MKKARIVLSLVALFAVAGGALAFKAMRNGLPAYTTTTAVFRGGQTYTLAGGATFYFTSPTKFITAVGVGVETVAYSTSAVPGANLTLTRVGGTQTITIPNYNTVTASTLTWITSVD